MNNPTLIPHIVPNWIDGNQEMAASGSTIKKINPANGSVLCEVTASGANEIQKSINAAKKAQSDWARTPPVRRGEMLYEIIAGMKTYRHQIAEIVHLETGKSMKDALGETDGAIQCALFFAGEGQRLYGKTCTSGAVNKYAMTVRQPIGIAGLIIASNTPIANVAWKVFPALICGNAIILKAAKDTPATSWFFGKIAHEARLPPGLLNIIQGRGDEVGVQIVEHQDIGVISFTGSTEVGKYIAEIAGKRMARISLELGGKNPMIICDDANLENAVKWVLLSGFSNAGQRCAAASRIIIYDGIYDQFKKLLVTKTSELKIGTADTDDFGPVINEEQIKMMLTIVEQAREKGAKILIGGKRLNNTRQRTGFFMTPTIIEDVGIDDEISRKELFGPIICLYRVMNFEEAVTLANSTQYGLTACIHTRNIHRAIEFTQRVQSGVSVINAGTFGSEPHMPFGGMKQSGNGTREPGTEALDVYSELKDIYIVIDEKEY